MASRRVTYNSGASAALNQNFTYATTWAANGASWTQKTTTVTTTDIVQNSTQSAQTIYTYTGFGVAPQPTEAFVGYGSEVPVEHQIQYYDFGGASPIRTVIKNWYNKDQLQNQQTVLNDDANLTSQVAYTYTATTPGAQISQKSEYDYGQSSPTRVTKYAYTAFASTLGTILDRPSSVITQNGAGTSTAAETDYSYDQFSVAPATAT